MGTDNIDIVLNEIDALFNIDFETKEVKNQPIALRIIRLGTSGAIQDNTALDSIVVAELAIGYDGLLGFYQQKPHRFSEWTIPNIGDTKGYIVPGSEILLDSIAKDYQKGITYTAAGFYAPQGRILRALPSQKGLIQTLQNLSLPENRKVTNIEMETAGLYGLGYLLGHEVISISVLLANRANGTFSPHPEKAIVKMIEDCLDKIENV